MLPSPDNPLASLSYVGIVAVPKRGAEGAVADDMAKRAALLASKCPSIIEAKNVAVGLGMLSSTIFSTHLHQNNDRNDVHQSAAKSSTDSTWLKTSLI